MKKIRAISLICILALLLCSCSAKMATNDAATGSYNQGTTSGGSTGSGIIYDKGYDSGASMDSAAPSAPELGGGFDSTKLEDSQRKLIKNGNFTLETLEYEKTINAIEDLISSVGGYVQNSNVSGTGAITSGGSQMRRATYTVRLPAADFGNFEEGLAACGSVLSRNVYVEEVTDYYYDSEARLSSLQTQEKQLLALMEKADKLDVIIQLQNELSNVRYQIESLQGTLRRLDSQIAYSTVNITIREVYEPTIVQAPPKTLGQRISYTFSNTWDSIVSSAEDFVVFVAGNILVLIFWAAVIAAAVIVVKVIIRLRKTRRITIKAEDKTDSTQN